MEKKNISQSFMICDPEAIFEAAFQACWDRLPNGAVLTASDGAPVEIISRGEWNHEAGPDFLNAKIRYHDTIQQGSIELHRKTSDYIRHGHLSDASYDNVILHVVTEDDLSGKTVNNALAHIPLCSISSAALERRAIGTSCRCRIFPYMHKEQLITFFAAAGRERMQIKSSAILEEMIRAGSEKAFRRALFRAAGYKRNQDNFLELCHRLEEYPEEILKGHFNVLIWGESGLIPDPAVTVLPEENRTLVQELWEEYWKLRRGDNPVIQWNRDSVRPLNMPERRIAMLCAFFNRYGLEPLASFAEVLANENAERLIRKLRKEFIFSDPFWDRHYTFLSETPTLPSAISGKDRAETLLIDVIAPSLLAYAKLENDADLEKKAVVILQYASAQRNNRIYKNAIRRWFPEECPDSQIFHNAETVQGCLHIYKQYCAETAGDCVSCLLANS